MRVVSENNREQPVRTLIDLLNNDLGYARIFAEAEGYGYELTTYRPRTIADLFERMSGYPSAEVALSFAQQQLESIAQAPIVQSKRRKPKKSRKQSAAN